MISLLRTAAILVPVLAVTACDHAGPAERAGRSLDSTAAQARDAVDPPSNPVDRARRELDRAVEPGPGQRTGRALDRATQ